jgi:hypothetical protein
MQLQRLRCYSLLYKRNKQTNRLVSHRGTDWPETESDEHSLSKSAIYKKDDGNKAEDTNKKEIKHKIQQKKLIKKRTYNEMMENAMSIDEDSSNNFKFNKIKKKGENS